MKRHIIAMIVIASASFLGIVVGLIVLLNTNYNWIAAIITGIVVAVGIELIGVVIALVNMFGIFKNPDRILR